MPKVSLKTKIDLSLAVVLIVFGVLVYSTYNRARAVNSNRKIIEETYSANTVLEKILSSTIDIETGVRGFTITGQPKFLSIYESGNKNLKEWQDSLEAMKMDSAEDREHIHQIFVLIDKKKSFTDEVLETGKNGSLAEAAKMIASGRGKEIMDSVRLEIAEYQNQQVSLLNQKLLETQDNVDARNRNFILFTVTMFVLIAFGYFRVRKGAITIMEDHFIQQGLADELAIQNRQLNEFANITSHNLRSSAANMTSLVNMVDQDSTREEYENIFQMLKRVAMNLNDSLNELIEIIRVKRGTEIQKETVLFDEIFNRVTETLQGDILTHEATVTSDFTQAPEAEFSKVYLESCFQNLIGNAMKYKSPERKPEIRVWSEKVNGQVLLHVRDNGLGIDLVTHGGKVFGMYQMFHKHPDAKGIGLFLTKAQIENLGGKISVASDGHSGTTFTIKFAR